MSQDLEEVHLQLSGWKWIMTMSVWLVLSAALALYIKYLMVESRFPYPILISLVQQVPGFLIAIGKSVAHRRAGTEDPLFVHRKNLLIFSLCFSASICMQNAALTDIHLSTVQLLKCLAPVLQMVSSRLIERKTYSRKSIMTVPLVVGGAFLGCLNAADYSFRGYALTIGSMVAMVIYTSLAAVVLQERQMDPINTWIYTSFYSCLVMLPPTYFLEMHSMLLGESSGGMTGRWKLLGVHLVTITVLAAAFCISNYFLLKMTSSVYNCMLGIVKMVLIAVIAIGVQPMPFPPIRIIGFSIAMFGFFLFNWYTSLSSHTYQALRRPDPAGGYGTIWEPGNEEEGKKVAKATATATATDKGANGNYETTPLQRGHTLPTKQVNVSIQGTFSVPS